MLAKWIWQRDEWPQFEYDETPLLKFITKFDFNNQISLRDSVLFENTQTDEFVVSIQGLEALKTSEIEGEVHDLPSLIQSFRVNASLMDDENFLERDENLNSRSKSVAAMMVHLYKSFADPISNDMLSRWNFFLTQGDRYAGKYRDYSEAMAVRSSIYSGREKEGSLEYLAPPSSQVEFEMGQFIDWYNSTADNSEGRIHPLIRAGLAHLYFVAIHPFDDGNGRIARALSIKAISEHNGEPTLIALSTAISKDKSGYYDALKQATKYGNITAWLEYFCKTAVHAQEITKAKLYQAAVIKTFEKDHELNECQKRAISAAIQGKCKRQRPDVTISEYIEMNKEIIRKRAQSDGKGFTELAKEDLLDMCKKGIFAESKHSEKITFRLIFPQTPGISMFLRKSDEEAKVCAALTSSNPTPSSP